MSWRQFNCLGCGEAVPSLFGIVFHCDPVEPIDDITDTDTP